MHTSEPGASQGLGGSHGGTTQTTQTTPSTAGHATSGTALIAIVEDDTAVARTYSETLESVGGWQTVHYADGNEALRQIPEIHPDVILLDMGLPPGVQGPALFQMLQGNRHTMHTPILIITALPEWQVKRSQLGTYRLLRKPCTEEELIAAVEELLAQARAHHGE